MSAVLRKLNYRNTYLPSFDEHVYMLNSVFLRSIFGFPFKPEYSKRKKFSETRILGYSKEALYEVVARVEDYNKFLPACYKSVVTHRENEFIKAELEIGFPPMIVEKYTSHVTLIKPTLVTAKCFDGKLFRHLDTVWKFSEGLPNNSKSCTLQFRIDFEFHSELYSRLTHSIFDELVRQTVNSFLRRAEELYGRPSHSPITKH
ncbi:coenzyme Q-binding protein COQ10 B-like isoform X1 [Leptotrombidium deliense]|uniref:Coenzyme Q-binding protein COQ10 B-like isoform X1 n=1 Tax=Leptotrombidium deliense TaxID=299467 RepID=A0A443SEL2_9ACAR|nr:coenzyme Q-binding protein COQ10 B-like isoform X1 [Leptotrombidium deliense]